MSSRDPPSLKAGAILVVIDWRYWPPNERYVEIGCPRCRCPQYHEAKTVGRFGRGHGEFFCDCGYAWPEWTLDGWPMSSRPTVIEA